jgi:hypothetical protein
MYYYSFFHKNILCTYVLEDQEGTGRYTVSNTPQKEIIKGDLVQLNKDGTSLRIVKYKEE